MEILSIQTIIQFKWETYTYQYYYKRFVVILIFICSLLFDFIFCQLLSDDGNQHCVQGSRLICSLVIIFFSFEEVVQFKRETDKIKYLKNWWNIFDILLILVYLIYLLMSFLYDKSNVTIAFQCLIVVLTFIKVIFFLRIFEKLSFLVQMVTSVFSDLRWFMLFFSVFITTFAVLINIVFNAH